MLRKEHEHAREEFRAVKKATKKARKLGRTKNRKGPPTQGAIDALADSERQLSAASQRTKDALLAGGGGDGGNYFGAGARLTGVALFALVARFVKKRREEAVASLAPTAAAPAASTSSSTSSSSSSSDDGMAQEEEVGRALHDLLSELADDPVAALGGMVDPLDGSTPLVLRAAGASTPREHHINREEREELLAEVENLRVEAAEAEHAANEAHAEIGNFQQNITDLSIQLAESGSKEQQYIKEQARLKGEIARLRYSLPQS